MPHYMQLQQQITFEIYTCGECDSPIALSDRHEKNLRDTGETFFCPRGHRRVFRDTETDRLRKKLDEQTRQATRYLQEKMDAEKARDKAERKLKRVGRGVCPDCNRTFSNLARHMCSKHAPKKSPE